MIMNYYIQGSAAKAEEIKVAFKKLGYSTAGWNYKSDRGIYFTNESDKSVDHTSIEIFANLIKTHPDYQELELSVEPKFKVGDWLVYENGDCFSDGSRNVQVQTVEKDRYFFTQNTNGSHKFIDNHCRLWTIQDAKDGDVLASDDGFIMIVKESRGSQWGWRLSRHCALLANGFFDVHEFHSNPDAFHPATKEQRDQLFSKMKEAGYTWDEKKKELRKIQPHYDIANFHTGMPVLVRDCDEHKWLYTIFGIYNKDNLLYPFVVVNMSGYRQCIPFEGNKHLLGTTDMCPEEYINW